MRRFVTIALCLAGTFGSGARASAQMGQTPRPERPYRGLFGGGADDAEKSLIANGSLGGGYDDNVLADLPGGMQNNDPRNAKSGGVGSFNGSLAFNVTKGRSSFASSVGSSIRYYPGQTDQYSTAHGANVGGSVGLGPRTSLTGNQSVSYQPFTLASIFPALVEPTIGLGPDTIALPSLADPSLDQATSIAEYWASMSQVGLNHRLSNRVNFDAGYSFQRSDTAYTGGAFVNQTANAGFLVGLTKSLGLRLGYRGQEGKFPGSARRIRTHNADVGVNVNKALSFSRRTTLSLSSGSTAISDGTTTTYQLVGSAGLNHEFRRTWSARTSYNRSVQLLDILLLPVIYDSVDANVGGLVNRRVQVQSGFRASIGSVGVTSQPGGNDFDTLQATAGVSVALNRFMQLGTTYSFFRYRFDAGTPLPDGVPRNIDRQSIRAQLELWAPIVNRARR